MDDFSSWGRYPSVTQKVFRPEWISDPLFPAGNESVLAYGLGRSYGDSCLNAGANIISTRRLNRIISFDQVNGILRAEAGLSIADLLPVIMPRGWFVPVSPGTQYVTLGGALANDVHGKNHHQAGSFGRHVLKFELVRSDGQRMVCSPSENSDYFAASIGGLGLTGLISWLELKLIPIASPYIDLESIKFENLDRFFEISHSSETKFNYSVAWIDCVGSGAKFGRGIFMRGNHSASQPGDKFLPARQRLAVPFNFPVWALNSTSMGLFNSLYFHRQFSSQVSRRQYFRPFFYPLDAVANWNRIYGRSGFFQFQCVVPSGDNNRAIREILKNVVSSGQASFLAVLKEFGALPSPGLMSFPRPGITLALDFPNHGSNTADLMQRLDALVREYQGAIYPAKDAWMSGQSFRQFFPRYEEFSRFIDARFSSSFWRRVMSV